MKEFMRLRFDAAQCRQGLSALRALLDGKRELDEQSDVKPLFEAHPQLAPSLGALEWSVLQADVLAYQYQLFGDYGCDLVVGNTARKTFGFIEWEDATATSIFRQQGKKATPEWASRYEHGYSQIIDWFCKLDDMARTDEFEARFGSRHIQCFGVLVIGRDEQLSSPRERRRWEWRSQKVLVNSLPIKCVTYDQLYAFLLEQLNLWSPPDTQVKP